MKRNTFIKSATALIFGVLMMSAMPGDEPLTRNGKQYIINTSTISTGVKGYLGNTPLKIYITNNKIDKIEALPNKETPKYFQKVKNQMLGKWDGMTVNKALTTNVDGVTGATYSSDAVKKNLKLGLEYYKAHK
jgi:electron transport complex protein RnfG